MLKLRLELVRVDYDQIVQRLLPEALEGSAESTSFSMRLAGKLLVKGGETSNLTKGVLKLIPQQTKESFAYHLVLRNQERIRETLNQFLLRELDGLLIESLQILDTDKAVYDVIKVEVSLGEIDYDKVFGQLVMKLLANLSQKPDQSGRMARTFLALGDTPGEMVTAALSVLSQEAKDQLLVDLFSNCQEDVLASLNHVLEQQGISAQVAKLKVMKE